MFDDMTDSIQSPEPINLLLDSLPGKLILQVLKSDIVLSHAVLQGFTAREKSLTLPVVRQRLEREIEKNPEFAETLLSRWLAHFHDLMAQLLNPSFIPTPDSLRPLLKRYSSAALRYGLLHTGRDDANAGLDLLDELSVEKPRKSVLPSLIPPKPVAADARKTAEQQQLATVQQERGTLKTEIAHLTGELNAATARVAELERQQADAERRLEREQRRVKKAEEEVEQLRKALKQAEKTPPAPQAPAVPQDVLDGMSQAITLLQRGLANLQGVPQEQLPTTTSNAPAPVDTPPQRVIARKTAEISVTLPTPRGKRSYSSAKILTALYKNDTVLLDEIRNGIAYLANTPAKERAAIADFTKAGIPATLLAGPLHPAVIDGSNIANMSPERRARMEYIRQVQRSAWREGYFPVIIIVDASLRYQIDRADQLMEMVEQGEIVMAPAGTSADALLIEEAAHRDAVLITNDRMTDWPAAKDLRKRHAEIISGVATVGSFHRAPGLWFR